MKLKEVMPRQQATEEIEALLEKKDIMPSRMAALQMPIDAVAEAMSYGLVDISADGEITQRLVKPVGGLTELKYKEHVDAATMQRSLGLLKVYNQPSVNACYICAYTGQLKANIDKLEPPDRNIADSISFFFQ